MLGLETQVTTAWPHPEPARLGLAEFRDRFPGQKVTPAILKKAIAMGLIALDGATVVVRDGALDDLRPQARAAGLDI